MGDDGRPAEAEASTLPSLEEDIEDSPEAAERAGDGASLVMSSVGLSESEKVPTT